MSGRDDFKLMPEAARHVLQKAPHLLEMLFPKWAGKAENNKSIARYLIEQASQNPDNLTDADIAVLDSFLTEEAAQWVKYRYVDAQAKSISEHLAKSPHFMLSTRESEQTDPSFHATVKSGIRSTGIEDTTVLDLYASIKAGEETRPGSFSKITAHAISTLSTGIIHTFERAASYVITEASPVCPLGIPDCVVLNPRDNVPGVRYSDILSLSEYGLISTTPAEIDLAVKPLILIFGLSVVGYRPRTHLKSTLTFFPLTLVGRELLRIHHGEVADLLPRAVHVNLTGGLRDSLQPEIRRGKLIPETGEITWDAQ